VFRATAAKIMVFAFDTTTNLAKTGDAANITAYISKDYGGVTVLGDTSATEMDATNAKGYYLFDVTGTEMTADVVMVSAKSSTANIAVIGAPAVIYTRPATGWLAPTTAGRTLDVSAGGEAGVDWANIGSPTTANALTGTSTLLIAGTGTGQLDFTSGVVKANLAQILGTALTETAGLLAGGFKKFFNVSSPTGTLNSIPDAVAGATGGLFIAGTNAATTVTTALTTTFTGNLTGSVASVTGAVGSVTGAVGSVTGNVGGNVTGSVGSVVGAVGSVTGAVGSVTGNVGGNVTGSVGSVIGAVGSVTGNVGGNVVGTVASVVGAVGSVTGLTASDVGAIKTTTDKFVFTVANKVDANIEAVNGTVINGSGTAIDPWGP
jgi:hypothetical protein